MASMEETANKLQKALMSKGRRIVKETSTFVYNPGTDAESNPVSMYHIKEMIWSNTKQKYEFVELFRTASKVQVVFFLRDLWYETNGKEIPTDNPKWELAKERYYKKKESGKYGSNRT